MTPPGTTPPGLSPQELAEACATQMWNQDQATSGLGIVLERIGPGTCSLSMVVQPRMLNGHGSCHGGFIFALADSAFAFACNTNGMASVASQCSVSFLRPVLEGERMLAVAEERYREGRSGITDVRVTVEGSTVAEFRGSSRTTGKRMSDHAD